jgi:hypothetical protein
MRGCEKKVRYEVLTAMLIKIAVFWDMMPCSLVEHADVSVDIFAYVMKVCDGGSRTIWNITFHRTVII